MFTRTAGCSANAESTGAAQASVAARKDISDAEISIPSAGWIPATRAMDRFCRGFTRPWQIPEESPWPNLTTRWNQGTEPGRLQNGPHRSENSNRTTVFSLTSHPTGEQIRRWYGEGDRGAPDETP
jgi:hypothetical protein